MGQALQRAQRQGHYGIGARVFVAFERVQQASRALPHARLPEVEVLWLNRIHCVRETAERLQAHALRHLRAAGRDDPPEPPCASPIWAGIPSCWTGCWRSRSSPT